MNKAVFLRRKKNVRINVLNLKTVYIFNIHEYRQFKLAFYIV